MSENNAFELKKNYVIKGKIIAKTGIMIGGNKDTIRIGGIDTPIIRDPLTGLPYIPGSTLKGKMRSLIERKEGLINVVKDKKGVKGLPHASTPSDICKDKECKVCVVFGAPYNPYTYFGRLVVRDSFILDKDNFEVEIKVENYIDRLTGKAGSPRTFERVPANTEFAFEMVYTVIGKNNDEELLSTVFEAMSLLEDSYIGSSGSRGYGKIEFKIKKIIQKTPETYQNGEEGVDILKAGDDGISPVEVLKLKPWAQ